MTFKSKMNRLKAREENSQFVLCFISHSPHKVMEKLSWHSLSMTQSRVLQTLWVAYDRYVNFRDQNPSPFVSPIELYQLKREWKHDHSNASSAYIKILRSLMAKGLVVKHPKKRGLYKITAKGSRLVPSDLKNY